MGESWSPELARLAGVWSALGERSSDGSGVGARFRAPAGAGRSVLFGAAAAGGWSLREAEPGAFLLEDRDAGVHIRRMVIGRWLLGRPTPAELREFVRAGVEASEVAWAWPRAQVVHRCSWEGENLRGFLGAPNLLREAFRQSGFFPIPEGIPGRSLRTSFSARPYLELVAGRPAGHFRRSRRS